MGLLVLDLSIELISALRDIVSLIAQKDPDLARQIRRAATSNALNLAEGRGRSGKDRLHCFRIARGSELEVQTGLRVAVAWGYLEPAVAERALSLLDRILAMSWGLVR